MTSEILEHYKAKFDKIAKDMAAEAVDADRIGFSMSLKNGKWKSALSIWYKAREGDDALAF